MVAMTLPPKNRMAAYRARQRAAGRVSLTLLVPAEDVAFFNDLAARRRAQAGDTSAPPSNAEDDELASGPRAETVAADMLAMVIDRGWPVGESLGSEAELLDIHGVSRPVLRQAVRLLEHQGVVTMRRGPGGGLVVRQPDQGATLQAVNVYLQSHGIPPVTVLHTRKVLELAAVDLAIERLNDAGVRLLQDTIASNRLLHAGSTSRELQRMHEVLGELAGDPALLLFLRVVLRLTETKIGFAKRPVAARERAVARNRLANEGIAEAVLARDVHTARERVSAYLDRFADWLR